MDMMQQSEPQNSTIYSSYNPGSSQANQEFLKYRLETENILNKIESFLKGERVIITIEDGVYIEKSVPYGKPLVNEDGRAILANILYMRINHHVVQGNFDKEQYFNFLERSRKELTNHIITNCDKWDIEDNHLSLIIDTLMAFIEPFMTRLIDNKEREGFAQQYQSREIITPLKKPGAFQSFAGGLK